MAEYHAQAMCEGCHAQFSFVPSVKIPAASFPLPVFFSLPQLWLITSSSLIPQSPAIEAAEVMGQEPGYAERELAALEPAVLSSGLAGEVDHVVAVVEPGSWLPVVADHGEEPTWA